MNLHSLEDEAFLTRLTALIEANLNDENFGVSELAQQMGISRSRLYVRVKSITNKSVSLFIREIRLKMAIKLLQQSSFTISEIAYRVGFNSPTYFNQCFHKQFGFPPGEYKKQNLTTSKLEKEGESNKTGKRKRLQKKVTAGIAGAMILVLISYFLYQGQIANYNDPLIEKSIIVLPFKNLSDDKNNQYFVDGIAEDILIHLSKITDLRVLSRTSAEQFRESLLSSTDIALQMNVNYILEGSIRKHNDDVRISIQLIDAQNNKHIWSGSYDRQMADIFVVQSDIAQNVANKLEAVLLPEKINQMNKMRPKNTKAYDYYLMGRYLLDKRDSASLLKSVEYFNKAIEIDSEYSFAYAGLADSYYALAFTGNIDRKQGYDQAYKMAEKVLEIDDNIPEAYAVKGIVNYFGYWNWEAARPFFKRALEIDSNCMTAHLYYSSFLDIVGENDKALIHANKANALEPYFYLPVTMKAIILRNDKKFTESIETFRKGQELGQAFWLDEDILHNYLDLKNETAAVKTLREIFSVRPNYNKYLNQFSSVHKSSGINGLLELYLEAIDREENERLFLQAALCARLGRKSQALDYLEKACREGVRDVPRIIRRPEYESLHSMARFQSLIDTMNLRPYFSERSE